MAEVTKKAGKATETKAEGSADVVVTETEATSTLSVVANAAVVPEVAKVRLFWQKSCGNMKESTNTPIKDNEVFVRTTHQVGIIPAGSPEGTKPTVETVYSLKRGKRIYYTPSSFITDAQRLAADTATDLKVKEKEAAAKVKADEKLAKENEKKAKAAAAATVVAAPTVTPVVKEDALA